MGLVLWHVKLGRLFNANFIYTNKSIHDLQAREWVWFSGISTLVGYLKPNSIYINKSIHYFQANKRVWFYSVSTIVFHLMPNRFYTYIEYIISKHILKRSFLNKPDLFFIDN